MNIEIHVNSFFFQDFELRSVEELTEEWLKEKLR